MGVYQFASQDKIFAKSVIVVRANILSGSSVRAGVRFVIFKGEIPTMGALGEIAKLESGVVVEGEGRIGEEINVG